MFSGARGGGRPEIGPQDGSINRVAMFSEAWGGGRLQMGPQDELLNWVQYF